MSCLSYASVIAHICSRWKLSSNEIVIGSLIFKIGKREGCYSSQVISNSMMPSSKTPEFMTLVDSNNFCISNHKICYSWKYLVTYELDSNIKIIINHFEEPILCKSWVCSYFIPPPLDPKQKQRQKQSLCSENSVPWNHSLHILFSSVVRSCLLSYNGSFHFRPLLKGLRGLSKVQISSLN